MADCLSHNFNSNRAPEGFDDPCNTSGEGIFESGSYWSYNPESAGADTALYGDCVRLWQRTGDACTVAEWLELQVASPRFELADPTATDCCPAGTVWTNENSGNVFISYADLSQNPPVCQWCQICGATSLVQGEFIGAGLASGGGAVFTPVIYTDNISDTLAEFAAGSFTALTDKCVSVCASFLTDAVTLPGGGVIDPSPFDWVMILTVFRNGVLDSTLASSIIYSDGIEPMRGAAHGCATLNLAAGDVLDFRIITSAVDIFDVVVADVTGVWSQFRIQELTC